MASVRDQPVAGEVLAGLDEAEVGRRDDQVGLLELLVVEPLPVAAHQLEHLLEDRVEAALVAAVDRRDRIVVQFVEPLPVAVGEPVLALRGDPHDHAGFSCWGVASPSPASSACGGGDPWPSSAFMRARSSSTCDEEVSSASWRSMSSPPEPSWRLSSNAPEASSSSTARCMARPTSAISSPTPVAASEILTEASAAEYWALMTSFLVRNWSIFVRSDCSFSISPCCWDSSSATCWSSDCSSPWANCLRSSAVRARSSRPWERAWRACVSSLTTCCSSFCCWSCRRFLDVTTSAMPFLTFWSSSICFW